MKANPYESATFQQEMEATWQGLKPLYEQVFIYSMFYIIVSTYMLLSNQSTDEQLHAYVRNKLNLHYGDTVVDATGPMPAHLLGNMWAQTWENIADLVKPYPDKPSIDVTEAMVEKGWTPKIMFEKADDFFHSLGMMRAPAEFWSGESSLINWKIKKTS